VVNHSKSVGAKFFLTVARDHQTTLKFTGIRIRIKIGEEKDLLNFMPQSHRIVTTC